MDIARGTQAYFGGFSTITQTVSVEQPVIIYMNGPLKNIKHIQGTTRIIIVKEGTYLITVDFYNDSTAQFSIYLNGVLVPNSTSGTDSGSGLVSLRQILLNLKKGDALTFVNHISGVGDVIFSENQGGTQVGVNMNTLVVML